MKVDYLPTEDDKVVILAHTLADLMDQADEGEINPSLGG